LGHIYVIAQAIASSTRPKVIAYTEGAAKLTLVFF
jgi:hypothetical protein